MYAGQGEVSDAVSQVRRFEIAHFQFGLCASPLPSPSDSAAAEAAGREAAAAGLASERTTRESLAAMVASEGEARAALAERLSSALEQATAREQAFAGSLGADVVRMEREVGAREERARADLEKRLSEAIERRAAEAREAAGKAAEATKKVQPGGACHTLKYRSGAFFCTRRQVARLLNVGQNAFCALVSTVRIHRATTLTGGRGLRLHIPGVDRMTGLCWLVMWRVLLPVCDVWLFKS